MFSVLLSTYKKEKPAFLKQTLESIAKQTLLPKEIVIVKDGTLTVELDLVIEQFQEKLVVPIKLVELPQNKGLGLALREGVLHCSEPYIARMDTDDIADKNRFEKQMDFLKKHSDVDLLGSWITEFSLDSRKPETITRLPLTDKAIRKFAKKRNPFRHMTMILKKEAVLKSGNYQDFLWFEDYYLWVRMLQNGCVAANLPEVLVNVRTGSDFYKRRSGGAYIKQEIKFQKFLYQTNFIGMKDFLLNNYIRITTRMLPQNCIKIFYTILLRNYKNNDK